MLILIVIGLLVYGACRAATYVSERTEHGRQIGESIRSLFDR